MTLIDFNVALHSLHPSPLGGGGGGGGGGRGGGGGGGGRGGGGGGGDGGGCGGSGGCDGCGGCGDCVVPSAAPLRLLRYCHGAGAMPVVADVLRLALVTHSFQK